MPSATPAALATSLTRVAWKPLRAKTRTAASRMRSRLSPVRAARPWLRGCAGARRELSEDSLIARRSYQTATEPVNATRGAARRHARRREHLLRRTPRSRGPSTGRARPAPRPRRAGAAGARASGPGSATPPGTRRRRGRRRAATARTGSDTATTSRSACCASCTSVAGGIALSPRRRRSRRRRVGRRVAPARRVEPSASSTSPPSRRLGRCIGAVAARWTRRGGRGARAAVDRRR